MKKIMSTPPSARSRDWDGPATLPIPVVQEVQEPQRSGGFSTRQKITLVLGLVPIILLAVTMLCFTHGIDPLGDVVIDLSWIPWPS
jgi:hypothetical protein